MKKLTPRSFMSERTTGLLVRGFAQKSEQVPARVAMMDDLITKALSAKVVDRPFIKRVDILVWANQRDYPSEADCGELAAALRKHFTGDHRIFVHEVTTGDLFCSILNYGIALQSRAGCDYSVIASAEANAYWSSDVPAEMVRLAGLGALATGVAINELTESVREGRLANTMAMWHTTSLLTVGGFDLRAQKPKDDRTAHYMKGMDTEGKERFYHLGGVEEVIPLARLVDTFGRCLGVIESNDPNLRYELPDQKTNPESYLRHLAKFGTKTERQMAHLVLIQRDFSHLRAGVMKV
jgi:hypothetical protein